MAGGVVSKIPQTLPLFTPFVTSFSNPVNLEQKGPQGPQKFEIMFENWYKSRVRHPWPRSAVRIENEF
jgi:hypothetical protein